MTREKIHLKGYKVDIETGALKPPKSKAKSVSRKIAERKSKKVRVVRSRTYK